MNTKTKKSVSVSRRFTSSAERVFDAWVDAKNVSKWLFATPTGKMVHVEIDARVGGKYIIVENREGEDVEHTGEYLEIDRSRRLVFTFSVPKYSDEVSKVTIDIEPQGQGCELTLTNEDVPYEFERQTAEGWNNIFDSLEELLG